jgi:hypothetical protein
LQRRLFCAAVDVHRDNRTVSRSAAIGIAKFVRGEQVDCPGLHGAFRVWEGAALRYYGAKATGPAVTILRVVPPLRWTRRHAEKIHTSGFQNLPAPSHRHSHRSLDVMSARIEILLPAACRPLDLGDHVACRHGPRLAVERAAKAYDAAGIGVGKGDLDGGRHARGFRSWRAA